MRRLSLLLILLAASVWSQIVIRDSKSARIIDRAIVVPRAEFTRERVDRLFRDFLSDNKKPYILLRLTVGVDEFEVARSLWHSPVAPYAAASALEHLKRIGLPHGPIARLMARQASALASYRGTDGKLSEWVILGQRDPTMIKVLGVDCRLLHFHFVDMHSRPGIAPSWDTTYPYFLTLYFQGTPRVSARTCAALTRMFAKETGIREVSVKMRSDTWFLADPNYPDVYRFQPEIVLPNRLQLELRPSVSCGLNQGELKCSGVNFQP
jgi:hypothetical protein